MAAGTIGICIHRLFTRSIILAFVVQLKLIGNPRNPEYPKTHLLVNPWFTNIYIYIYIPVYMCQYFCWIIFIWFPGSGPGHPKWPRN